MAVQSAELLLDEALDSAVRAQWQWLAAAGLPSQARHTGPTNAPHVTLAVRESIPQAYDAALAAAAGLPLAVRLGGLVVFAHRRCVLARAVVPTEELLALHACVYDALTGAGPGPDNLAPSRWTPHVTLARGLTSEQVGSAVAVLSRTAEAAGQAVALRRWDGAARRAWTL